MRDESDNYQSEPSALRILTMSTMIRSWRKFTENTSRRIQTLSSEIQRSKATALMNYRLTSIASFLLLSLALMMFWMVICH